MRPSSSPIVWSLLPTPATRKGQPLRLLLPGRSATKHGGSREARHRSPRAQVMEFNARPGDQSLKLLNPSSRICTLRRSCRPASAPTRTKELPRLRYYHCKVGSKKVKPMAPAVRRITHLPCCQAGAQSGCSSPMLRIWCWTGQNLPVKAVGVSRLEKGCK